MKTTDPRDPLDQKIDQLLASQPVKAPTNFSTRILAEIEDESAPQSKESCILTPILRFALPLAAAVALAFIISSQMRDDRPEAPTQIAGSQTIDTPSTGITLDTELSNYEIQEIMLLQDGLSGFAQIESEELSGSDLLDTLNTLYSI